MSKTFKNTAFGNFWSRFKDGFMEGAGKLGNQRHLAALRDAFALFTPLIIVGSLAVIMRTFVFGAAGGAPTSILGWIAKAQNEITLSTKTATIGFDFAANSSFAVISKIGNFAFYTIERATYGAIAIYFAFGVGYFIARSRKNDSPIICGMTTLAAVMAANGSIGWGAPAYIDSSGLITAIIIGFSSAELFCLLSKSEKLLIKMPAGVPPAVARSFAKLFPILIILVGIAALQAIFMAFGFAMEGHKGTLVASSKVSHYGGYTMTIGDVIYYGIQSPFLKAASNKHADLGLGIAYALSIGFLWTFGIHGSNVMNGIFGTIFIAFLGENVLTNVTKYTDKITDPAALAAGATAHVFVQGTFDAFIFLGGTGATMGWIIASFLFSKRKSEKEIAKFSAPAAVFQINEPVIFGVPMIVNPIYAIPFIFLTPILCIMTYFGIATGMVPIVKVWIPWTTPAPIGGLLATSMSWQGFVLATINLVISIFVYAPFVLAANTKAKRDNEELSYALVKFGKRTQAEKNEIAKHKNEKAKAKKAKKAGKK